MIAVELKDAMKEHLGQDGLILTPNRDRARLLVSILGDEYSGRVLPLGQWVRSIAGNGTERLFLDEAQTLALWESIISADSVACGISPLAVAGLAKRAQAAFLALVANDYENDDLTGFSADGKAFLRWRNAFKAACVGHGWVDPVEALTAAEDVIRAGEPVPAVIFWGYEAELPPRVASLAAAIEMSAPVRILGPVAGETPSEPLRAAFATPEEEVLAAARWATLVKERGPIAVLVPNPTQYLSLIERLFRAELEPASSLFSEGDESPLALPSCAGEAPLVVAAMEILALSGPSISVPQAGFLLRSPFLTGYSAERENRAILDRELRAKGRKHTLLSDLAALAAGGGRRNAGVCGEMAQMIEALSGLNNSPALPSVWAMRAENRLCGVGWLGTSVLTAQEHAAINALQEAFAEISSLDFLEELLSQGAFVALLSRKLAETPLPRNVVAPVQVMPIGESAGLNFTCVWLLGACEGVYPPPVQYDPFLPSALQRGQEWRDQELVHARKVLRRIVETSLEVVVSHPAEIDGRILRPSQLVAGIEVGEPALAAERNPVSLLNQSPLTLEKIEDGAGPAIVEGETVRGGTAIFKDQALCPFRAFAHHRLQAKGLDTVDIGPDAFMRGTLIHAALEVFWKQVRNSRTLRAMSGEEVALEAEKAVIKGLVGWEEKNKVALPKRFRSLEIVRLTGLLQAWLEIEKQRDDFEVVGVEVNHEALVAGIPVSVQVDRVDRLQDGSEIVLDYKTGLNSLSSWIDKRLTDPQMPIYALLSDAERLGGLVWGQLRAKESKLIGLVKDEGALPGVGTVASARQLRGDVLDWESLFDVWRGKLDNLGAEFRGGRAVVAPVKKDTCRYCDLKLLCRRSEICKTSESAA